MRSRRKYNKTNKKCTSHSKPIKSPLGIRKSALNILTDMSIISDTSKNEQQNNMAVIMLLT